MGTSRKRHHSSFGSVTRLPSGRFRARYTGPDGLRRTAPATFDTKTAAQDWLAGVRTDLFRHQWSAPERGDVPLKTYLADAPRVFGNGPDALLDDLNSAFRQPRLDPADVPQQVAVFHGAHDQVSRPVVAEVLTELLPDATCHVIDDGGHWIHVTHAPVLLEAIAAQEAGASE